MSGGFGIKFELTIINNPSWSYSVFQWSLSYFI